MMSVTEWYHHHSPVQQVTCHLPISN